jgi:ribosomal protein S10
MFINIKILSKNQKSLKNFIIIFNSFCLKNLKNKDFYTVKKKMTKIIKTKWPNKSKIFLPLVSNFKVNTYKKIYRCKIKKNVYIRKRKVNGLLNYSQQKQKRKVFTALKSPHVNKTAQEQLEYRLFSKRINIFSFQILKFLVLVKKIQMKLCPDIEIQIKFVLNNKIIKKTKLVSLNPDNYKINSLFFYKKKDIDSINRVQKFNKTQILSYLKLFDLYGELSFKPC